jgi:hypothetical protein
VHFPDGCCAASFGITLYEILARAEPYEDEHEAQVRIPEIGEFKFAFEL